MVNTANDPLVLLAPLMRRMKALSDRVDNMGQPEVKRYGIRINMSDSNPDTRVEYLYDAIGMRPAKMDYTKGSFDYGDWKDVWFVAQNRPCMVKFSGEVDYYLNPMNYAQKPDGSASDCNNLNYGGNCMAEFPQVWCKIYTEGNYKYKIFCPVQYDESYHAYAFTRPDGTVSRKLYYPAFKGSLDSAGRLRSIGGVKPASMINANAEVAAAAACGENWGLLNWQAWTLLMDLQELISKSTDRQSRFGQGHSDGATTAAGFLTCGSLKTAGQFFGSTASDSAVKTFHVENPYGERWERLQGMLFINGVWYVKDTPEGGYNFTGEGYTALACGHPSGEGFIMATTADEHGDFPRTTGGTGSTYECDHYYQELTGVRVPVVGAGCSNGPKCGRALFVYFTDSSENWNAGGSPFLQSPA